MAVDSAGYVYVTGLAGDSWNGPDGEEPLHACSGLGDLFVLKLAPSGAYQWHTFYGTSEYSPIDKGYSIAVDSSGNIFVAGDAETTWNGPSDEAPLRAHSGGTDAFVLALDSDGSYRWHTFLGSDADDGGRSIAVDGGGGLHVAGFSGSSWTGPSAAEPAHAHSGGIDAFVVVLDGAGAYQWHTFYGSATDDRAEAITVDATGAAYLTGFSDGSWTGPSDAAALHAYAGSNDIFVAKLDAAGGYLWHTFYGGTSDDEGYSLSVNGAGVYVTGSSDGWSGPDGEEPLHAYSGEPANDLFVLELDPEGAYCWHTFYGDVTGEWAYAVAVDDDGDVFATGYSNATWTGPSGEAPLHALASPDLFVIKLSAAGDYLWHTFYGSLYGYSGDEGRSIATDGFGHVYVAGQSDGAWAGPTDEAPLHDYSGSTDFFVLKLVD